MKYHTLLYGKVVLRKIRPEMVISCVFVYFFSLSFIIVIIIISIFLTYNTNNYYDTNKLYITYNTTPNY